MFYHNYMKMFKRGEIATGFSSRIPDYGIRLWLDHLERAVKSSQNNTFIDIGAGRGRLSAFLAQNAFKNGFSIEVDVDRQVWDKVLQQNKNLQFIEGFLQQCIHKIPSSGSPDFVLLAEVFEHIPPSDVDDFINALSKIMKPGSKLFLTTPNFAVQGPAEKSSRWYKIQPYGHHKHYSLKELIDIFEQKNFKVEWASFESGRLKRRIYNRLFYPFCRLDQKLLTSKKVPRICRHVYKYSSLLFIYLARLFFCLLAQAVYHTEKRINSEKNAETIIMFLSLRCNK